MTRHLVEVVKLEDIEATADRLASEGFELVFCTSHLVDVRWVCVFRKEQADAEA